MQLKKAETDLEDKREAVISILTDFFGEKKATIVKCVAADFLYAADIQLLRETLDVLRQSGLDTEVDVFLLLKCSFNLSHSETTQHWRAGFIARSGGHACQISIGVAESRRF